MPPSRRPRILSLLAAALLLGAAAFVVVRFAGAADPCATATTPLVVTARGRALWVCEGGRARERLRVSLGSGGLGKRVQGDRKTPLGVYTVGEPRPSARFGTFILIGYPTDAQRRQGFTGQDVGIHGPERRLRWLGPANAWLDWTAGCVAVADEEALARLAALARRGGASIEVR